VGFGRVLSARGPPGEPGGEENALEGEHAGADHVGEAGALVGVEEGVDLLEGFGQERVETRDAFGAAGGAGGGFGGVEGVGGHGVGEIGEGAAVVDGGLGAFGFDFVEDAGEFGELFFVEAEFVGEEAEGPADAEGPASTASTAAVKALAGMGWKMHGVTSEGPGGMVAVLVGILMVVGAAARPGGVTHERTPSRPGEARRAGTINAAGVRASRLE